MPFAADQMLGWLQPNVMLDHINADDESDWVLQQKKDRSVAMHSPD